LAEINPGDAAPDFSLRSCDEQTVSLADFSGRALVLYFYPNDDTPGCTTEAQDFRDRIGAFAEAGAAVVGVSPDSVRRHCGFRDKYALNFTLLADPEHRALEAYGVWVEKKNYGRAYMGVERSTFLIDGQGVVRRVWRKVRVRRKVKAPGGAKGEKIELAHADEVLQAARGLGG
jgi:peroxiredoxin